MTPPSLLISESAATQFLAADFWIGSGKVFCCRFLNRQRQSFHDRFLNWQQYSFHCQFLKRQQLSLIKSLGNKPDCLKELRGRGKIGFGHTKIGTRTHLNQPQTPPPHLIGSINAMRDREKRWPFIFPKLSAAASCSAACLSSLPPS